MFIKLLNFNFADMNIQNIRPHPLRILPASEFRNLHLDLDFANPISLYPLQIEVNNWLWGFPASKSESKMYIQNSSIGKCWQSLDHHKAFISKLSIYLSSYQKKIYYINIIYKNQLLLIVSDTLNHCRC